jgi:hypothetical protein
MLCCDREEKVLGMVRVSKQAVIDACNRTLRNIWRGRSDYRKNAVAEYLKAADWNWRYFWRWLGFRKPSRRDALNYYYHGSSLPDSFTASMLYGQQEDKANKILRAANATPHSTMWISTEGANAIRL